MKKKELENTICETLDFVLQKYYPEGKHVKPDDLLCADKWDMMFFKELISEKLPEDFSFLDEKEFQTVGDLCSEIEKHVPVYDDNVKSPIVLTTHQSVVSKNKLKDREKE